MYFSSVRGNFFKAQVQNHYENVRCDLHIKDVSKRHVHSLANINKSIREVRDTLRDIQASSGYCKEVQRNEAASKLNVWKEWSAGKPNDGDPGRSETQVRRKTSTFQEIKSKNLDFGEQMTVSKINADDVSRSSLFLEKNEQNIQEQMENFVYGKNGAGSGNGGYEMNGDRSDIVPAGRLLRDEILMPDGRNVSGRIIKGPNRQGMDSTVSAKNADVKEPQGKSQVKSTSSANGSNFQNMDTTSAKLPGKSFQSLTSRTDEPPEFAIASSKLGKSRPNTGSDGLMGYRSQTAPAKASHLKSASAKGELKKNSSSRYLSANDVKKVKIHVNLSRTERKRILQELISSCTVPCDRSVLERQRQRLLQEKIDRFFELLFQQDDKYDKDDESDIFGED